MENPQLIILGVAKWFYKRRAKTLTEKIRHQIHHPENCHNAPYTEADIRQSIEDMRTFIMNKRIVKWQLFYILLPEDVHSSSRRRRQYGETYSHFL